MTPTISLTHAQALVLFALVISATFAMLSRQGFKARAVYALRAFLTFLLVAVGLAWLMLLLQR